jgi:hypothetical protein
MLKKRYIYEFTSGDNFIIKFDLTREQRSKLLDECEYMIGASLSELNDLYQRVFDSEPTNFDLLGLTSLLTDIRKEKNMVNGIMSGGTTE